MTIDLSVLDDDFQPPEMTIQDYMWFTDSFDFDWLKPLGPKDLPEKFVEVLISFECALSIMKNWERIKAWREQWPEGKFVMMASWLGVPTIMVKSNGHVEVMSPWRPSPEDIVLSDWRVEQLDRE